MIVWLYIALLLVAILLLVAGWLLRPRGGSQAEILGHDLRVYRDQLKELERDVERGLLDETEAEAARLEVQRRLLNASEQADKTSGNTRARPLVAGLLALVLGGGSVGLYLVLGSPDIPDMPFVLREQVQRDMAANGQAGGPAGMPELETALATLSEKLKQNPDNLEGWLLLGRTHLRLQNYQQSADAFANAEKQGATGAVFNAEYGVSLVFSEEGNVSDKAAALFHEALKERPRMILPRHHLALKLAREQRFEEAVQEWKNLLTLAKEGDEWVAIVNRNIAEAARMGNLDPETVAPSPEFRVAHDRQKEFAPPLSRETVEDAERMGADEQSKMIQSMVERLANRLKDNPDDLAGWLRLGNAYRVLGRAADSADAYARAAALDDGNPDTAALYQRALVEAAQKAEESGDSAATRKFLGDLLSKMSEGSPEYDLIKQRIEALQ